MAFSFKGSLGVSRGKFNSAVTALVPIRLKHTYLMLYLDAVNTWGDDDEHSRRLVLCKLKRWDAKYGFDFPIVDHRTKSLHDVRNELETTSEYSYNRVDPTYFESRGTVQGHDVESINNPYQPPPPMPEPRPLPPRKVNAPCSKCGRDHHGHGIHQKDEFKAIMATYGCTI